VGVVPDTKNAPKQARFCAFHVVGGGAGGGGPRHKKHAQTVAFFVFFVLWDVRPAVCPLLALPWPSFVSWHARPVFDLFWLFVGCLHCDVAAF